MVTRFKGDVNLCAQQWGVRAQRHNKKSPSVTPQVSYDHTRGGCALRRQCCCEVLGTVSSHSVCVCVAGICFLLGLVSRRFVAPPILRDTQDSPKVHGFCNSLVLCG